MEYTAIGDNANLTCRIQDKSPAAHAAVITRALRDRVDFFMLTECRGEIVAKGKKNPIAVSALKSLRSASDSRFMPANMTVFLTLPGGKDV